jgi:hypothetical protein
MAGRGLAQRIVRHPADHRRFMAEPGKADRDIGFGAGDVDIQATALQHQFPARRRQAQQQLAEAGDAAAHRPSQPPSTARTWPLT